METTIGSAIEAAAAVSVFPHEALVHVQFLPFYANKKTHGPESRSCGENYLEML